jgi:hypothetical protein
MGCFRNGLFRQPLSVAPRPQGLSLKRVIPAIVAFATFVLSLLGAPRVHAAESFAVVGDAGNWDGNSKEVRDSIVRSGLKRLVIPGDNLYNLASTYAAEWAPWSTQGLTFDVVAIGNHHAGYPREVAFFKMPGEFYSKSFGSEARFIVLNSDHVATAARQSSWLREQLESATESNVFVVFHHPSLTLTSFHKWKERREFQESVRPLLFEYRSKITAVLNGHDHIASLIEFNDLPVVVSGAVQDIRPSTAIDNVQAGISVKTRWLFDLTPHWVRLDAESGSATVRFVRASDDRVMCSVTLARGKRAVLGSDCR